MAAPAAAAANSAMARRLRALDGAAAGAAESCDTMGSGSGRGAAGAGVERACQVGAAAAGGGARCGSHLRASASLQPLLTWTAVVAEQRGSAWDTGNWTFLPEPAMFQRFADRGPFCTRNLRVPIKQPLQNVLIHNLLTRKFSSSHKNGGVRRRTQRGRRPLFLQKSQSNSQNSSRAPLRRHVALIWRARCGPPLGASTCCPQRRRRWRPSCASPRRPAGDRSVG